MTYLETKMNRGGPSQDDTKKENQITSEIESSKGKEKMAVEDTFFSIERISSTDLETGTSAAL